MRKFIVSDIHGNYGELWQLLNQAGLVDDDENRTELGKETYIVSIGDLLNAVLQDVTGDELCASIATTWFDKLLVGNHEWPYLYDTATFNGYHPHPPLRMLYNQWKREGFVVPSLLVGETLVTHAGWAFPDFGNAYDAHKAITKVWDEYPYSDHAYILDGIGYARGGMSRIGGILWSDWNHEKKNKSFSQIVGHTPNPKGPILHEREDGTYTICIDTGCKGGGHATGVFVDEQGQIEEVVTVSAVGAETVTLDK